MFTVSQVKLAHTPMLETFTGEFNPDLNQCLCASRIFSRARERERVTLLSKNVRPKSARVETRNSRACSGRPLSGSYARAPGPWRTNGRKGSIPAGGPQERSSGSHSSAPCQCLRERAATRVPEQVFERFAPFVVLQRLRRKRETGWK
jgi:hypothetical protein